MARSIGSARPQDRTPAVDLQSLARCILHGTPVGIPRRPKERFFVQGNMRFGAISGRAPRARRPPERHGGDRGALPGSVFYHIPLLTGFSSSDKTLHPEEVWRCISETSLGSASQKAMAQCGTYARHASESARPECESLRTGESREKRPIWPWIHFYMVNPASERKVNKEQRARCSALTQKVSETDHNQGFLLKHKGFSHGIELKRGM